MANRLVNPIIGLLGMSGVALGAFGAHALKAQLAVGGHTGTWETAVLYQLTHTVAMLALSTHAGPSAQTTRTRLSTAALWFWMAGIIMFSGSLYALSLGGPKWLGPVTPLGGLALLAGWGCVLAGGLSTPKPPET